MSSVSLQSAHSYVEFEHPLKPPGSTMSFCKNTTTVNKGQPSNMVMKKKNNPFSGSCLNEHVPGKRNLKTKDLSKGHNVSTLLPGPANQERGPRGDGSLIPSSDHRTFFNDPAQVRQWAANSATGSDADLPNYGQCNASYRSDPSVTSVAPHMPRPVSVLQPSFSHISLQSLGQMHDTNGQGFNYNGFRTNSAANTTSPMDASLGIYSEADCVGNIRSLEEQTRSDTWSYPTPSAEEMMFSNHLAAPPLLNDNGNDDSGHPSSWPMIPFQAGDDMTTTGAVFTQYPMTWSPLSAIDPSVSSSLSQNSFLAPQPNTPMSPTMHEGTWPADQNGPLEEENLGFSTFSMDENMQIQSPAEYSDSQTDTLSTMKPVRTFQRIPMSSIKMWPQSEVVNHEYMPSPLMDNSCQRRSSEGEATTAREHPLYQVGPTDDGLYHCPFAGKEDCSHRPEKLKCNYDKHLDSHLKPYRCKVASCVAVPFSSTACLLRHEREAHGMHGHGEKPHLCGFEDCDRSVPGNGFPRRWNLFDHMKRVHDYTGPASSIESSSPTPSSVSSFYQGMAPLPLRKRRTSSPSQAEPLKRTKSTNGAKALKKASKAVAPATPKGHRQSMQKMWFEQKAAIRARLDTLDPNDVPASEQINADCALLHTIGLNIRRQDAGQLARG